MYHVCTSVCGVLLMYFACVCINNHKMEQTTASDEGDDEEPKSSVSPAPKVHL